MPISAHLLARHHGVTELRIDKFLGRRGADSKVKELWRAMSVRLTYNCVKVRNSLGEIEQVRPTKYGFYKTPRL